MTTINVTGLKRSLKSYYRKTVTDVDGHANEMTSNGESATAVDLDFMTQRIVTGGSAGSEDVDMVAGTYLGERVHIKLVTRTNASDEVLINNLLADTSWTLGEADDELVAEWNGTAWALVLNLNVAVV